MSLLLNWYMQFLFTGFFPDVLMHTRQQDEDQIRSNYDRGTDFYYWFAASLLSLTFLDAKGVGTSNP